MNITVNILSQIETEHKVILNGISPGGGDKALLESNLSTLPALSGDVPFFYYPDGVKALNSGGEAEGEGVKAPLLPYWVYQLSY
jgi:hypothetical protein